MEKAMEVLTHNLLYSWYTQDLVITNILFQDSWVLGLEVVVNFSSS